MTDEELNNIIKQFEEYLSLIKRKDNIELFETLTKKLSIYKSRLRLRKINKINNE